jgi:DDE superfamily endonuclease/Tc5 transposase DNA-binding domain
MESPFEVKIAEALEELAGPSKPSLRAIEKKYGVCRKTLKRRHEGHVSRRIARQQQQLLSAEQEQLLVSWILMLEAEGHAPTHNTVREMAGQISRFSGGPATVGNKWLSRFFTRHPNIHSKLGKNIDALRIQSTSLTDLRAWFSLFRRVLTENKVAIEDVWNMDESGLAIGCCTHQKVIGSSSSSRTYKKAPQNREWVSIVETVSAAGKHIRCLVIFKGKNIQSSWFRHDQVPDWQYTCSENGWTSNNIGIQWLKEIFIPETLPKRAGANRILLLDNHGSHITTEFMWICFQNNIRLVYLPPHSSHVLQPLDLSIFSQIKRSYRTQVEELTRFEDSAPIKKIRFVAYYNHAREEVLNERYIRAGWRGAGLFPWDPEKVLQSRQIITGITTSTAISKRPNSSSSHLQTPQNKRQLLDAQMALIKQQNLSRSVRTLFDKTAKAFGQLHYEKAHNLQQLNAQAARLEDLNTKKKKKVPIGANELFAGIEEIKAAQEAQQRQIALSKEKDMAAEARKTADAVLGMSIAQMSFEFSIFDPTE